MNKLGIAALALVLAACGGTTVTATLTAIPSDSPSPASSPTTPPSTSPTASPSPTPAPTASPSPSASPAATLAVASPWPGCINGWRTPPDGAPKRDEGVTILANYMGLTDPLVVADMRYFRGPDPDNILEPRFENLERWYIKATLATDPTYRGRWLIEKRTDTILGVSAVAPHDTTGYQSPDWSGFVGEGPPRAIDGLPGMWSGIQYDFVTGQGDSGFPGLPASQAECMSGT
jgi:hypothetical protein